MAEIQSIAADVPNWQGRALCPTCCLMIPPGARVDDAGLLSVIVNEQIPVVLVDDGLGLAGRENWFGSWFVQCTGSPDGIKHETAMGHGDVTEEKVMRLVEHGLKVNGRETRIL